MSRPHQLASALLLATFLLLLTVGLWAQGLHVWVGMVVTEIGLLALPTWMLARAVAASPLDALALRRPSDGRFEISLNVAGAVGPLASLMAMGLTLPVVFLLVLAGASYPGVGLPLDGWGDFTAALLTGAILAPVCEEMLFRGFLLESWRPAGPHAAVWVSAAAFGIFHADPVRFVPTAALGLVFGYLALYGGSIWPAVVAHAMNNGLALGTAFFFGGAPAEESRAVSWETVRPELVQALREAGVQLADGQLESAARAGLALLAAAFLVAGIVLAVAVALALRGYARRMQSLAGQRLPQVVARPGAGREGSDAPGEGLPAAPRAGRPLVALLGRDPAAWAFVVVGLVVWGLSFRYYFGG